MTDPMLLTPSRPPPPLGIGRSKLYELMQDGILESVHIGACRRIPQTPSTHSSTGSAEQKPTRQPADQPAGPCSNLTDPEPPARWKDDGLPV